MSTSQAEMEGQTVKRQITRYYTAKESLCLNVVDPDAKAQTGRILSKGGSRDVTPEIYHTPFNMTPEPDVAATSTADADSGDSDIKELSRVVSFRSWKWNDIPYKQMSFEELLDLKHFKHKKTKHWAEILFKYKENFTYLVYMDEEDLAERWEAKVKEDSMLAQDADIAQDKKLGLILGSVLDQWVDRDRPILQKLDKAVHNLDKRMYLHFGYMVFPVEDEITKEKRSRRLPFIAVLTGENYKEPTTQSWYCGGQVGVLEGWYTYCYTVEQLGKAIMMKIDNDKRLPPAFGSQEKAWPQPDTELLKAYRQ